MTEEHDNVKDADNDSESEFSWDEYVRRREQSETNVRLEGKDYVALFIAALQTIFLPLIVTAVVFVAAYLIFISLI